MNIKKNQYKKEKKSMIGTNQHLLEQVEKKKLVIIRLKAKLRLKPEEWSIYKIEPDDYFHFHLYGLSLCQQVIKDFLCMPVKSQILQAHI